MQLTSLSNFFCEEDLTCEQESIIFHEPVKNTKFAYESIKIETENNGPLVNETPFLFSFGVTERRSQDESNKLVGYSIPVCLWSKDEQPTPEEKEFYDFLESLEEFCRDHLGSVYDVEIPNKLNDLLYYKQIECTNKYGEKYKKNDETTPPITYIFRKV